MYQDVEYNGVKGSSFRIYARERPSIPAAVKHRTEVKIPGRDGVLYEEDGTYEPTKIPIQFNYIGKEDEWNNRWRLAQKWLSASDSRLRFTDDAGYFFKISHVELGEAERPSERVGVFTATFYTYDGLSYLVNGTNEYSAEDVGWNPYEVSHPIYLVKGEGNCKLTVNGKIMTANVGGNLTIDTERMVAYRSDQSLQNTKVSGRYSDLYLQEGENSVSITTGFDLKVIPNWRCR